MVPAHSNSCSKAYGQGVRRSGCWHDAERHLSAMQSKVCDQLYGVLRVELSPAKQQCDRLKSCTLVMRQQSWSKLGLKTTRRIRHLGKQPGSELARHKTGSRQLCNRARGASHNRVSRPAFNNASAAAATEGRTRLSQKAGSAA